MFSYEFHPNILYILQISSHNTEQIIYLYHTAVGDGQKAFFDTVAEYST